MQGQWMTGERRPVCEGRTHWRSGDKVTDGGSNEAPRTGRGVGQTVAGEVGQLIGCTVTSIRVRVTR